jgi:hypothetical protein
MRVRIQFATSSLTLDDIHDLEQQLEYAINKVMLF